MSTTLIDPEQRSLELERASALRDYLAQAARAGDVSRQTADQAWEAWRFLNRAMSDRLPVPDAAPGQDGELFLTWDRGELHLELEYLPGGSAEFFSRDRMTGALWGEDFRSDAPLSSGVRERLRMFL